MELKFRVLQGYKFCYLILCGLYPTLRRRYSSPILGHNVRTLYSNKLKSYNNRILCMISLFIYEIIKLNITDI